MLSRHGEPNKVDAAFISPCNEFGLSPLMNERRVNLRTVTSSTRKRLEMKVEERHGWALSESHGEILDLKSTLEDERYEHLLAKEALALRVKKQKAKDKESLTQAEEKQHKLQALVVAADISGKELERRLRLETMEAHNAVNTTLGNHQTGHETRS